MSRTSNAAERHGNSPRWGPRGLSSWAALSGECSALQDDFQLHWPLVNSDHMATRLAKQELEKKRLEDAKR